MDAVSSVAALILAAGQSRRMGRPKMILPWGEGSIIETVARVLLEGGAKPVVVVTGGARRAVEAVLGKLPVRLVHNPDYKRAEMLASVQVGLRSLDESLPATLIALGDQPQIQVQTVRRLLQAYQQTQARLIVPSYQMQRGHPWLVGRELWPAILDLSSDHSLRDFLTSYAAQIQYLEVEDASVLQDIDTPEQYARQRGER